MSPKTRLGLMMFLQYAIWGAWAPVLSAYLINDLGFSGGQVGWIYALLPLATIVSPFVGGQLADRYVSTEKVIAFLSLTGGALLIVNSFYYGAYPSVGVNVIWIGIALFTLSRRPSRANG